MIVGEAQRAAPTAAGRAGSVITASACHGDVPLITVARGASAGDRWSGAVGRACRGGVRRFDDHHPACQAARS
ncbi:hypothetical protein [Pseudonocardia pini]|uniref:hypothetical protein n=1 Tax=Pseudonocardia pini TaxID=2758030 RepID=UPI0015F11318|nr:hypothetical protein [Pseudonocardia pini]